ncbi:MAG: DUF4301 family protein [Bacteroidaceae bacterium]|nr:DUF4301 family protein [Bacteroidaceae bacterium]
MFDSKDLELFALKGIDTAKVEGQLADFRNGFPFLDLRSAASEGNGIKVLTPDGVDLYVNAWERYRSDNKRITKFVPASGAASRMFKNLFAFLNADYDGPTDDFEKTFFGEIEKFAFYDDLDAVCLKNEGNGIKALMAEGKYKAVVSNLLESKGLNYGSLPKGLLKFHKYGKEARTPLEEHLVEGALYASMADATVNLHFTVSPEHRSLFENLAKETSIVMSKKYGLRYRIGFSEQKPSTDTIAVDSENAPFRNDDGSILFRPGGHGALIANLNEIDSDVIFVKNIDNVVPDSLKTDTVTYKKVIAGVLVSLQSKFFGYLKLLDSGRYDREKLMEILGFLEKTLCCTKDGVSELGDRELLSYLRTKLNRPIRVCGMVKNVGEPGGGPFIARNSDGSYSLQILESSQIDMNNQNKKKMFSEGTHFNPVDLVCAVRDYRGEKFDLTKYVDPATGFISSKSKNGRELKALELPGLWNGAMSDWTTLFVEVPLSTFNPVKTVNDLLRKQHQN